MMLFKTFWKVINKYKGTIILYTVMLVIFGGINMTASNTSTDFTDSKPSIKIVNKDDSLISSNLVNYLESVSDVKDIKEDKIDDAIFYRDISYVIYIPDGYGDSIYTDNSKKIDVKSVGDYKSVLASNTLNNYLRIQSIYKDEYKDPNTLVDKINANLEHKSTVNLKSKLDVSSLTKASRYYSFASYSIMAVVIFIICLVMSSFNEKNVRRRTVVSSKSVSKFNFELLLSSITYGVIVFILYTVLAFILLGDVMFSMRGLIYIANSFVFTIVSLTLALLVSSLINNKDAISGIVNVLSLGSAFLCGAFVPAEMLPEGVLSFAHVLPAYYYINSNDLLASIEVFNYETLKPIINNFIILALFVIIFILFNNVVSIIKRKSA